MIELPSTNEIQLIHDGVRAILYLRENEYALDDFDRAFNAVMYYEEMTNEEILQCLRGLTELREYIVAILANQAYTYVPNQVVKSTYMIKN